MKKLSSLLAIVLFCVNVTIGPAFTQTAPPPKSPIAPRRVDQQFLNELARRIDEHLKGKSVGYQFYITAKNTKGVGGAGGDARRAPDPHPRMMTFDDKINVASVSKTITAAAVLRLLYDRKLDPDTLVSAYLPADWVLGPNFQNVTFANLLTHRAGIRCDAVGTYTNLKKCVADGVQVADMSVQKYNNINFGLFRMIIPILNGFDRRTVMDDQTASAKYAGLYIDYVRKKIFAPIGLTNIECKPIAQDPALCYQYPTPIMVGDTFNDMTETNAYRGWNLSAKQLATILYYLFDTEKVIPAAVQKQMTVDQLGLFTDATGVPGVTVYAHGGYYPGKDKQGNPFNNGELNSAVIRFANGVNVGVIVNSQFGPGQSVSGAIKTAMKEALGL